MLGYSNKKNKAVALKYNADTDKAPVIIASGYGEVANKIINIAEQNGIPVYRDDSAASLMCMLDVGSYIPPELYEVIAAIYCQLLKSTNDMRNGISDAESKKK
ncbi:MAG: EscU/YscU/HrcU family type III secretion system export apparatus switch protein [Porcipelethomonas sp.]